MDYQGTRLANPLFDEMSKYPRQFAHPVFFRDAVGKTRNGSGFLVLLEGRTFGITCHHVVAGYREQKAQSGATFQFGAAQIEPLKHIVDESEVLDIVVFDFTELVDTPGGLTAASRISPAAWPPGPLVDDDVLALAGFPGSGRQDYDDNYYRFHSFSAGTVEIASLRESHLYTRIELDQSIVAGARPEITSELGGLSGGPVLVWRKGVVLKTELVGMVVEYQKNLDLLFVRRLGCVRSNGTLDPHAG